MRSQKASTLQLVGGLGNQLFGFYAGLFYTQITGNDVKFDTSQLGRGFTSHSSSITSFEPLGQIGNFEASPRILKFARLTANKVFSILMVPQNFRSKFFKIYSSPTDGYDQALERVPSGYLIRGYFQTYKYVEHVRSVSTTNLSLINPSKWFQEMARQALANSPIMVHVRRGDYSKLAQEFGLLDARYFLDACEFALRELGDPHREIWIFSDDIPLVRDEFESAVHSYNFKWICVPEGIDDAESLVLMSHGAANVISNSTFSWWAAMLNGTPLVIAPEKWFRGKPDPNDLIPPSWVRLPSTWRF